MSTAQSASGRTAPPGVTAGGPVQRHLGLALAVIATAQLMVVLDATIVNVALPHIQRALGFSGSGLEWVVNAYALTFGGLLLLGGRAGDILGRRRMFIVGIILFAAASLFGGFATTQTWLLTARAIQGVGGAIVAPAALSLVTTTFPEGPPRNRAMGVYAAMSIGGAAVGLILGGVLTTYLSWRWVFFVNVPIAVVVALLAPRVLGTSERLRGRFDLPGAITGTLGVVALVYGLSTAAPPMLIAAYTLIARLRGGPSGNVVVIRDSAAGATIAPPTPWITRAVISQACVVANPPNSEAAENRMMPITNIRRRPRMSPARPPRSRNPPNVSA